MTKEQFKQAMEDRLATMPTHKFKPDVVDTRKVLRLLEQGFAQICGVPYFHFMEPCLESACDNSIYFACSDGLLRFYFRYFDEGDASMNGDYLCGAWRDVTEVSLEDFEKDVLSFYQQGVDAIMEFVSGAKEAKYQKES